MPSADTLRLGCSDEDTDAGMGAAAGATDQVISNRGELDTRPRGGFSFGNMGRFPFHGGDGHHLQKSSAEILEEKRALYHWTKQIGTTCFIRFGLYGCISSKFLAHGTTALLSPFFLVRGNGLL